MTIHYLNKGVKYHLGNNRYSGSVDKEFLNAYSTIGLAWAQPFSVSRDDEVQVTLDNLWGVDYGSQPSNIRVFIGDVDIGQVNVNRQSWTSPMKCRLRGGQTYLLKIATFGPGDEDDFVFEGVTIATASGASVTPQGKAKVLQFTNDDYYKSNYDTGQSAKPAPSPQPVPQPVYAPTPVQYVVMQESKPSPGCWGVGLGIVAILIALASGIFAGIAFLAYTDIISRIAGCLFSPIFIIGIIFGLLAMFSGKKIGKILCVLYIIFVPVLFAIMVLLLGTNILGIH